MLASSRIRAAAELLAWLSDRGQGDRCGGSELDVVVADQGDVVGHPDLLAGQPLQHAEGQQVVGAEDRGWAGGPGEAQDA